MRRDWGRIEYIHYTLFGKGSSSLGFFKEFVCVLGCACTWVCVCVGGAEVSVGIGEFLGSGECGRVRACVLSVCVLCLDLLYTFEFCGHSSQERMFLSSKRKSENAETKTGHVNASLRLREAPFVAMSSAEHK